MMKFSEFISSLLSKPPKPGETFGEIVSRETGGANLVEGRPTFEHADSSKDSLATMRACCDAEIATWEKSGNVPAPFFFERVAILLRKQKEYEGEVECLEKYLSIVDQYASDNSDEPNLGILVSARYLAIRDRLPKAKQLRDRASAITRQA